MRVVSSDANSNFIELGMAKSVLIEWPTDIKDVLIPNPKIVNAIVLSKRRVSIVGVGHGETDVFFLDANDQQVGALDIAVVSTAQSAAFPASFYHFPGPAAKVLVERGFQVLLYSCTPDTCTSTLTEEEEKEAKTSREVCEGCGTSVTNNNK